MSSIRFTWGRPTFFGVLNTATCILYAISGHVVFVDHPFFAAFATGLRSCLNVFAGAFIGHIFGPVGDICVIVSLGTAGLLTAAAQMDATAKP